MGKDTEDRRTGFARLERDILNSEVFMDLTKMGILVLLHFINLTDWKTERYGKRKVTFKTNPDQIMMSFDKAESKGFSRSSFNRGLTDIIEHGFFRIKRHGSGLQKDPNVYAWSDEWRKWGTPEFKPGERPKAKTDRGFKRGNALGHRFKPL